MRTHTHMLICLQFNYLVWRCSVWVCGNPVTRKKWIYFRYCLPIDFFLSFYLFSNIFFTFYTVCFSVFLIFYLFSLFSCLLCLYPTVFLSFLFPSFSFFTFSVTSSSILIYFYLLTHISSSSQIPTEAGILIFFSLSLFHLQWRPTLPLHSVVSRLHETHNLAEMKTSITFILSLRACCKRGVIVTEGVCVVVWLKRNILYQIHLKSYYHRQLWGRFNQQAQLHASAAEKRRIESDLHSPTDRRHFGKCWRWQEKEWRRKHIPDGVCVVRINVTDL